MLRRSTLAISVMEGQGICSPAACTNDTRIGVPEDCPLLQWDKLKQHRYVELMLCLGCDRRKQQHAVETATIGLFISVASL